MVSDMVIMTVVLALFGGFMGTMYLRMIPRSSKSLREKNKDLDDLNNYNRKELRSLRAKVNGAAALPKVSGDIDDIEGVVSALLPKITNKFPELKGLIGDNDISQIIKLAKQHPDIVKKFLPKFISSGKKDDPLSSTTEISV